MLNFIPPPSDLTPNRVVLLLWSRWRLLLKIVTGFGVLSAMYALLTPSEYTAEASLMPEFQAGSAANLKGFGALAELAGIDLEGTTITEAVRPDLYPDILTSTPFLLTTLNRPVTTTRKNNYPTLVAFLTTSEYTPSLTWLNDELVTMPQADSVGRPVRLSRAQEDFLKDFRKRIVSNLDKQSGLIGIRVKMPDAEVAAQVCQQAISYLTHYVVQYRTNKTRTNLTFLAQRLAEAKSRYDRALRAMSAYGDQNRFLYTQSARIEGKRLEAEHDLAQSLYTELSRQYEQTRIKMQEETPILTVLEPPKIPVRRSEPYRMLIVLVGAAMGLIVGTGYVLYEAVVAPALTSGLGQLTTGHVPTPHLHE